MRHSHAPQTGHSTPDPKPAASEVALPWWRQLRWHLVLSSVLIALLPVVVVMLVSLSLMRHQAEQQVFLQLESVMQLKMDQITRWLRVGELVIDLLKADPGRARRLREFVTITPRDRVEQETLNEILSALAQASPSFERLFVYDRRGEVLLSSDAIQVGKIVLRKPYFRGSLAGNYLQSPYYEVGYGALTMFITRPLLDQRGQTVGVLAGQLNLSALGKIMTERSGLGETGETYLVSLESHYLLTPSRHAGYILTRAYRSTGIDQALAGAQGFDTYVNYQEPPTPVLGAYRWLAALAAGMMVEISAFEALATYRQARNVSLFLAVVTAVAAAFVGFMRASHIAEPITRLTRMASRIAQGAVNQRLDVTQRNEIGVLAAAFNTMTMQLQQTLTGLEQRVTELQQAEERQAQLIMELEAKNAELERFTYTVSHDLKSPLITIQGFLGLLEQDVARADPERIRLDIQQITHATGTMKQLLDDLLSLSRIGRVVKPPQEVSMAELARQAVDLVAGQITDRGVHVDIAPNLPVVWGDRERLLEVLQNLLDNAVKFLGDQPEPCVSIGALQQDGATVCYVRDNGVGIDPRYHDKVFGLFERLDATPDGTGIGLALVKRIVEVHGGHIWVESEGRGQGCTFCFTLPSSAAATHA